MIGCRVEFFESENRHVVFFETAKKHPEGMRRLIATVRSHPAMNEAGDWFLLLELDDGTFRSIDAYCLRVVGRKDGAGEGGSA